MSININEICRLCMCSENTLQPLFGPSENLLDRIHKISSVIEVSNFEFCYVAFLYQQK
jgi:hypothetical protein